MVDVEIPEEYRRPDDLRRALAGDIDRLPPSLALAMLPQLDIDESEQREILHEAVEDRRLEAHVRASAVIALANLGGEDAVPEILSVLDQPALEEQVAVRAVSVLGRLARPEHLGRLEAIETSAETELLQSRAVFARALIVHRFGLTDVSVNLPIEERQPAPERAGALTFISRRMGHPRRRHVIEAVNGLFPEFVPREHDAYELHCGSRLLVVVVRNDLVTSKGTRKLSERPAVAAIVASLNEETGDFFPSLVALSRPGGQDAINLLVARLSGDPLFLGEGSVGPTGVDIELNSAQTPGVPAVVAWVRVSDKGLEISGISSRRVIPGRIPESEEPTSLL